MGLSNNELIKFAVDSITAIVEGVNKLLSALSGGNGLIKTIGSLAVALSAFKIGKSLLGGKMSGLFGRSTEVTERKTTSPDGTIVEEKIVKNPKQKGIEDGKQYAEGFR